MGCKYIYKGKEYTKEEFIDQIVPEFKDKGKTRRILEVQSDLFQKGRDKARLAGQDRTDNEFDAMEETQFMNESGIKNWDTSKALETKQQKDDNKNNFLQLLNKDNNWVTFFVKSIIQDSAKKGYEKVLFPKGDTAAKVEGHETVEEFIKNNEIRLKTVVNPKIQKAEFFIKNNDGIKLTSERPDITREREYDLAEHKKNLEKYTREKEQLEKEIKDAKEVGLLKINAVAKFYEDTIKNVLNKQYGDFNVKAITDEYGNGWYELNINSLRDSEAITIPSVSTVKPSEALINKYLQHAQDNVLAPNGKPSILYKSILNLPEVNGNKKLALQMYQKTQTPQFKQWFGDSQMIDENLEPQVFYHYTNEDVNVFDINKAGNTTGTNAEGVHLGFFFSSENQIYKGLGKNLIATYLKLENPAEGSDKIETGDSSLQEQGYDGIINDTGTVVVFDPGDIKSVFNRGSFITEDNNLSLDIKRDDYNPDEEGGEIWKIDVIESGQNVGKVMLENDGTNLTIFDTEIRGGDEVNTGTNAYLQMADQATKAGLTFRSDVIESKLRPMSDGAKNLWNRFVRTGQAVIQGGRYVFTGNSENVYRNIYSSLESQTQSSKAGEITQQKVIRFLNQIGFTNIQKVKNLFHNGQQISGNGYIDFMTGVMQIVEGKEDIALPEESMHILVELISQSSPELYRSLEKEIVNYQLYRDVVNDPAYKIPDYQKDGQPDYDKLKKEAIAKLLVEYLINDKEGTLESAEKIQKVQSLWRSIIDWIRNTFSKFKDPFQKVVDDINEDEDISEKYGKYEDLTPSDSLFLSATTKSIKERDDEYKDNKDIYNKVHDSARDSHITKVNDQYFQNGQEWKGSRVSDKTDEFYKKLFRNRPMDPAMQDFRDQAALDGKKLHSFFEEAVFAHVDPITGLLKNSPDSMNESISPNPVDLKMNRKIYDYVRKFLSQFDEGTRFSPETIILDNIKKVLGTVDLLAIHPNGKTDIFDWKTVLEKADGLADYKKEAFNIQINEYKRILEKEYGIKDFGKLRAIQIHRSYADLGSGKSELVAIKIGDPDASKITEDNLRPFISTQESTGDMVKDNIIKNLSNIYQKFVDEMKANKNKNNDREILRDISDAIYDIRIKNTINQLNKYLVDLGGKIGILREEIAKAKDMSPEQMDSFLIDISTYQDIFEALSQGFGDISPLALDQSIDKKQRENMKDYIFALGVRVNQLKETRKEILATQAKKVGISNLLNPEKVIKGFSKTFRAMGSHPVATIRYFYELTKIAFNKAELETDESLKSIKAYKKTFDEIRKNKGWSEKEATAKFLNFEKGTLHSKISHEFFEKRSEVASSGDGKKIKKFIADNYDRTAYDKWYKEELQSKIDFWKTLTYSVDPDENKKIVAENIKKFEKNYNIDKNPVTAFSTLNKQLWNKNIKEELWISKEYQELEKDPKLLEIYNYFLNKNKEVFDIGAIDEWKAYNFFPNVKKTMADILSFEDKNWAEKIKDVTFNNLKNFKKSLTLEDGELNYESKRHPVTGALLEERYIPYITSLKPADKSFDLFTVYALMSKEIAKEKYLQKNDETSRALLHIERAKANFETNKIGGIVRGADGKPLLPPGLSGQNTNLLEQYVRSITYGQSIQVGTDAQITFGLRKVFANSKLGKAMGYTVKPDVYKPTSISATKVIMALNNFHQRRILGLNASSALSNLFGGTFSANKLYKKTLTNADLNKSWVDMTSGLFYKTEEGKKRAALADYFLPHVNNRENWKASQLSVSKASTILSQEWLMSLQRKTDEVVGMHIFFALLDNTGLINGQLVNLREMAMDELKYSERYNLSPADRTKVEKELDSKVQELKDKHSLIKQAIIKDDIIEIPGVDRFSDTVEHIRDLAKTMTKDALGGIDEFDQATYRNNIYWRLFMTFKNWIPRAADVRFAEFHYSQSHHAWDYGRFRMVWRSFSNNYFLSLAKIIPIVGNVLNRTDAGKESLIEKAMQIYAEKKAIAEELGQVDDNFITEGDFVDMYIQGVNNSFAEFRTAILMMTILMSAMMVPDDDDSGEAKNWKKLAKRQVDKMQDEVGFFYNPKSMIDIANQSAPIIGLVRDSYNLMDNVRREMLGDIYEGIGDEEKGQKYKDKAHPLKYTFKILPVMKEIINYIPTIDSEMGKEWGISLQNKNGF